MFFVYAMSKNKISSFVLHDISNFSISWEEIKIEIGTFSLWLTGYFVGTYISIHVNIIILEYLHEETLEFVLCNLTECIFVDGIVFDFLFSKLWNFPLFFGGKIQSLLNKKSKTIPSTKIHSVRLEQTDSNNQMVCNIYCVKQRRNILQCVL